MTLDTSGLLSLLDVHDPYHARAVTALRDDPGPFLIPLGIMAEAAYMIEHRLSTRALLAVLSDIERGAFTLYIGQDDVSRVRDLVERYSDLPLGYADAVVAVCAARSRGHILTLDHRHFEVIAPEIPHCTLLPALEG
jgi:uncharacterized protein